MSEPGSSTMRRQIVPSLAVVAALLGLSQLFFYASRRLFLRYDIAGVFTVGVLVLLLSIAFFCLIKALAVMVGLLRRH